MVKKLLKETVKLWVIEIIVTIVWQMLELIIYRKITPRQVDTIVSVIFTLSIYLNLEYLKYFEFKKSELRKD